MNTIETLETLRSKTNSFGDLIVDYLINGNPVTITRIEGNWETSIERDKEAIQIYRQVAKKCFEQGEAFEQ